MDPFNPLNPAPRGDTSRTAARRTYGRARAQTPEEDVPSLFFPPTTAANASTSTISPAKALLQGFQQGNQSWRESLARMDLNAAKERDNEDEELELLLAKTKQQYAKKKTVSVVAEVLPALTPVAPTSALAPTAPQKLGVSFSSSSLTDLPPTSPLPPSSPPKMASPKAPAHIATKEDAAPSSDTVDDDETAPVRKSGMARSGPRSRRVLYSDDKDEVPGRAEPSSPSPSPRKVKTTRALTPPLATTRNASLPPSSPPASTSSTARRNNNKSAHAASSSGTEIVGEDSDEDDATTPTRGPGVEAYFATLAEEDRDAEDKGAGEAMQRGLSADSAETIKDGSLRASGSPEAGTTVKQGKMPKGLTKREKLAMEQDFERARREREVTFMRPEPKAMPLSSWALDASNVLAKRACPKRSSPASEAIITPADDITTFTPSSSDRHDAWRKHRASTTREPAGMAQLQPSSPAPYRPGSDLVVPETSDDMNMDAPEKTMAEIIIEAKHEAKVKRDMREKKARLDEAKAKSMAARIAQKAAEIEADLDFTVSPEKPKAAAKAVAFSAAPVKPEKPRGPDAKAVLRHDATSAPAISRNRQRYMAHANVRPSSRAGPDVPTETHLDFAGKAWKHDDLHNANAGTRPAGQKAGRDKVVKHNQLDFVLTSNHAAQARLERERKERDFGKGRMMPQREEVDYEEIKEMSARRADMVEEDEEGDEEDEGGDDDFVPSGEEQEEVSGDEEQSGSEDELVADDDVARSGSDGEGSVAKVVDEVATDTEVNSPIKPSRRTDTEEDDEESSPLKIRRPRASARTTRFAITSDDEDESARPGPKMAPPPVPTASLTSGGLDSGFDLDIGAIGGFGDDEAGFSQLFEPTQINSTSGAQDGFAGLRAAEALPAFNERAMLPQNIVSATQAERDNALIAAEVEMASATAEIVPTQPKKQYLNDAGFFTQTKPVTQYDPESQARRQLGGSSEILFAPIASQNEASSSGDDLTESLARPTGTQGDDGDADTETDMDDHPEPSMRLRRLKRRESDAVSTSVDELEPTQKGTLSSPEKSETAPRPRNAFDTLMAARNRDRLTTERRSFRSNLVDEQAEESDEDNGWGPTGGKEDDEEDEGEDGFVEGLVDDQAVDAATKQQQDALAEAKRREVEMQDDSKREEEARKITEGQYRHKRRGRDFVGDESDDEVRRKRWTKKQRKLRRLDGEDGLSKLPGEANAFVKMYEEDLSSDDDDDILQFVVDVARTPEGPRSYAATRQMLLDRGAANRGKPLEGNKLASAWMKDSFVSEPMAIDIDAVESDNEDSQFLVSKPKRTISGAGENRNANSRAIRSTESYAAYVQEESQANRRTVGISSAASVVVNRAIPAFKSKIEAKYGPRAPPRQNSHVLSSKKSSTTTFPSPFKPARRPLSSTRPTSVLYS